MKCVCAWGYIFAISATLSGNESFLTKQCLPGKWTQVWIEIYRRKKRKKTNLRFSQNHSQCGVRASMQKSAQSFTNMFICRILFVWWWLPTCSILIHFKSIQETFIFERLLFVDCSIAVIFIFILLHSILKAIERKWKKEEEKKNQIKKGSLLNLDHLFS